MAGTALFAQAGETPQTAPTATYTDSDGNEQTVSAGYSVTEDAPLTVSFTANATNTDDYVTNYKWQVYEESDTTPYIVRYEEDMTLTFTSAGTHNIILTATFTSTDGTSFSIESEAISIAISESKLEFPNAFSPNGDGINDIYKAKDGYQSIVEFEATIYNRWGQKIYSWNDPSGGWDGTFNGKPVKQGVYFVNVKAKGADGRNYHIRRDVNLLRGYTESSTSSDE